MMPNETIGELITAVVRKHYIQSTGVVEVSVAQMWNGEWWMPIGGCDTLENMLDDMVYAVERREMERCHMSDDLLAAGKAVLSSAAPSEHWHPELFAAFKLLKAARAKAERREVSESATVDPGGRWQR